MKISAAKYAQTLFELTEGKEKNEIKKIINDFLKVLVVNNDFTKANEIINEFEKIIDKQEGIVRTKVLSANELEKESVNAISQFIKEKTDAKKIEIEQEIKKDLLGGVVIRFGDKVIDASLKAKLRELKNKLTK